jgi:hypothetical protein
VTGAKVGKAYDDAVSLLTSTISLRRKLTEIKVAAAKDTTHKVDAKLESYRADADKKLGEYRQKTGEQLGKAVDKFDKSVEKGAAESKSWISGWFGGK